MLAQKLDLFTRSHSDLSCGLYCVFMSADFALKQRDDLSREKLSFFGNKKGRFPGAVP
jgi:hypothetical protein